MVEHLQPKAVGALSATCRYLYVAATPNSLCLKALGPPITRFRNVTRVTIRREVAPEDAEQILKAFPRLSYLCASELTPDALRLIAQQKEITTFVHGSFSDVWPDPKLAAPAGLSVQCESGKRSLSCYLPHLGRVSHLKSAWFSDEDAERVKNCCGVVEYVSAEDSEITDTGLLSLCEVPSLKHVNCKGCLDTTLQGVRASKKLGAVVYHDIEFCYPPFGGNGTP